MAHGVKSFKDQFDVKYVKKDSKDVKQKAFAEIVAEVKCNLCHQGKSKKDRNPYGQELAKLLDKKADMKNVEKIKKVLDQVAKLKFNPKDKKSLTFGELIAAGKLPGGKPKEEKKAPPPPETSSR
jgi:hypothetical protein